MTCGMVFIRIINEINKLGGDLIGDAWDWFITTTQKPEFKRDNKNDKMQRKDKDAGDNQWQQYGKNQLQLKAVGALDKQLTHELMSKDLDKIL